MDLLGSSWLTTARENLMPRRCQPKGWSLPAALRKMPRLGPRSFPRGKISRFLHVTVQICSAHTESGGQRQQHSGHEAQVWERLGGGRHQRYPAASKSGVLCLSSDVALLMVNCVTVTLSVL